MKNVSDHQHKEPQADEIYNIFQKEYLNINDRISLVDFHFVRNDRIHAAVTVKIDGVEKELKGDGNGRLMPSATRSGENLGIQYQDLTHTEHALEQGPTRAAAFHVGITGKDGKITCGAWTAILLGQPPSKPCSAPSTGRKPKSLSLAKEFPEPLVPGFLWLPSEQLD